MSRDIKDELGTPLQRLAALPQMMAWRGEWNATDEFFRNNIVVDPTTTGSYVYTGFSASISGGLPPSQVIGPSIWTAVGTNVAAGVQVVREGAGIIVDGSDTTPTINNNGVITLTAEGGLGNIGTAQYPILVLENSLLQVQAGLGISVSGGAVPTISNTGIVNLLPGAGISITGDGDVTAANTGVISITAAPGTALTITAGQNPTITNTGAFSVSPGLGIAIGGVAPNEPQIDNAGVISIVPHNIQVTGGFPAPGDKQLAMLNPIRTLVFPTGPLAMVPSTIISLNSSALIDITQSPGTLWASIMQNGLPYSTGIFMVNFALKFTGTASSSYPNITLFLQDNTQSPTVELGPFIAVAKGGAIGLSSLVPERTYLFPDCAINIAQARALGFRRLTGLRVFQGANLTNPSIIRLTSSGNCWATYFSQTVF